MEFENRLNQLVTSEANVGNDVSLILKSSRYCKGMELPDYVDGPLEEIAEDGVWVKGNFYTFNMIEAIYPIEYRVALFYDEDYELVLSIRSEHYNKLIYLKKEENQLKISHVDDANGLSDEANEEDAYVLQVISNYGMIDTYIHKLIHTEGVG
jgi:hypothetical protein